LKYKSVASSWAKRYRNAFVATITATKRNALVWDSIEGNGD
jgi:hypothetical protein